MRTLLLVALMLALSLSGCTGTGDDRSAADEPGVAVQADPAAELLALDNSGSGCFEAVAIILIPMERAAAMLPDGFTPADAQGLLGTPAPTGKGAAVIAHYVCRAWGSAEELNMGADVNVLVSAPAAQGAAPHADNHFYQLVHYASQSQELELLQGIGWNVHNASLPSSFGWGTLKGGTVEIAVEEETLLTLDLTVAAPNRLTGLSRFWHVTDGRGTWYVDYGVDVEVFMGHVTCTIAPGSPAAELVGATTCDEAVGAAMAPDNEWTSRYGRIDAA